MTKHSISLGRHHPDTPRSKRLLTDDGSNILICTNRHSFPLQPHRELYLVACDVQCCAVRIASLSSAADMSGHGGNGFLKFQDSQELTSQELADAFAQMHEKGRCVHAVSVLSV